MRPGEVVVHVRKPLALGTQQVVQFGVLVVALNLWVLWRARSCGVFRVPRWEHGVERLQIVRVVSDACVVRVPSLIEVGSC